MKQAKKGDKNDTTIGQWNPTQGGVYTAYIPEYCHDGEWIRIPTNDHCKDGIPQPSQFGHINHTIGLYGYEQAQAIAWQYAAHCAGKLFQKTPKVRVQSYEVHYTIKARKLIVFECN